MFNVGVRIDVNGMSGFRSSISGSAGSINRFGYGIRSGTNHLRSFSTGAAQAMGSVRNLVSSVFNLQNVILGAVGLAAGGSLFEKIIGSNATFQANRLGMGAIINGNLQFADSRGHAMRADQNFMKSLKVSSQVMKTFEDMALKSPGTSDDLIQIFKSGLNPALGAGKSITQIEDITLAALTYAKVIGNDIPQASRDLQFILSGTADSQNKTWGQINKSVGLSTEAFNKLPSSERFDRLSKTLKSFATKEVLEEYAMSWGGLTSSLEDFQTIGFRTFGGPLFKELSGFLKEGVNWLIKNKASVQATAAAWGQNFVGSIRSAITAGREIYGVVSRVHDVIQTKLAPVLSSVGKAFDVDFGGGIREAIRQGLRIYSMMVSLYGWGKEKLGPVFAEIGRGFAVHFASVNAWLQANQPLIAEAWKGFQMLSGIVLRVGSAFAAILGMGIVITIEAIGLAVLYTFAQFRKFYAFVESFPLRMANAFDGVKIQFLRLGAWLLDTAKRIPVLGILFGIGDVVLGGTAAATANIAAIQGAMDRRALEITAGDPTDPRKQYGASRLLALDQTRTQGAATANTTNLANSSAKTEVIVNQNITTSDPVVAGNIAAAGVQKAIPKKAPNPKVGSPLTLLNP